MKKIVALVLTLAMVMGLAVTAMAADTDAYDVYAADAGLAATMLTGVGDKANDKVKVEVPAVTYTNGSGAVAYVLIDGVYYAKISAAEATVSDFVLASKDGKTVLAYLTVLGTNPGCVTYGQTAVKFDKFSLTPKCGYVTVTTMPTAADVYVQLANGKVFSTGAASATEAYNVMVDGVVYQAVAEQTVVSHSFKANNYKYDAVAGVNVPTSAICTTCLTTSSAIYLDGKVPAGVFAYDLAAPDAAYAVVVGAAAVAPEADGEKVESAETFDAGIAMYVGMSVMAAAGSAVVLKKKD